MEQTKQSFWRGALELLGGTHLAVGLLASIAIYLSAGSILAAKYPEVIERGLRVPADGVYGHWLPLALAGLLLVNMLTASLARIPLDLPRAGAWCSHMGLLVLAAGAAWYAMDSQQGMAVTTRTADGWTPITHYYLKNRYSIYLRMGDQQATLALPPVLEHVHAQPLDVSGQVGDVRVKVTMFAAHGRVMTDPEELLRLHEKLVPADPQDPSAMPMAQLEFSRGDWRSQVVLALGGDPDNMRAVAMPAMQEIHVALAPTVRPLCATLRVLDAQADFYPGSDRVKDYRSRVELDADGVKRADMISLNHPLRFDHLQLSQSDWRGDPGDPQMIVLGVASRQGIGQIWAGLAMIAAGLPWAFYVKPWLLRRRGG